MQEDPRWPRGSVVAPTLPWAAFKGTPDRQMGSSSATGSQSRGSQSPASEGADRFLFVVPGRLQYRDAARTFLAYVCDELSGRGAFPEDVGHQVVSAFVEAFNNAVIHAYHGMPSGPVEVALEVGRGELEVRVTDRGQSFAPETVPEPDLDALPEGGLGLFIIRNFMDDVCYERVGDKNVLTMTKSLLASTTPQAHRAPRTDAGGLSEEG